MYRQTHQKCWSNALIVLIKRTSPLDLMDADGIRHGVEHLMMYIMVCVTYCRKETPGAN